MGVARFFQGALGKRFIGFSFALHIFALPPIRKRARSAVLRLMRPVLLIAVFHSIDVWLRFFLFSWIWIWMALASNFNYKPRAALRSHFDAPPPPSPPISPSTPSSIPPSHSYPLCVVRLPPSMNPHPRSHVGSRAESRHANFEAPVLSPWGAPAQLCVEAEQRREGR